MKTESFRCRVKRNTIIAINTIAGRFEFNFYNGDVERKVVFGAIQIKNLLAYLAKDLGQPPFTLTHFLADDFRCEHASEGRITLSHKGQPRFHFAEDMLTIAVTLSAEDTSQLIEFLVSGVTRKAFSCLVDEKIRYRRLELPGHGYSDLVLDRGLVADGKRELYFPAYDLTEAVEKLKRVGLEVDDLKEVSIDRSHWERWNHSLVELGLVSFQ